MARLYFPNREKTTDLKYQHRTMVDGVVYQFRYAYHLRTEAWVINILDASGDALLIAWPLQPGSDILGPVKRSVRELPQGSLNVELPSSETRVTASNLGVSVLISYDEPS